MLYERLNEVYRASFVRNKVQAPDDFVILIFGRICEPGIQVEVNEREAHPR